MARAKRKRKERARRLHQEPIVRRVAEILATGTPTKWRWTSVVHHGVRSALCLKGLPWTEADKRAGEIVTLARHRIGISLYPSWTEAQGAAPEEREHWFCGACGGRLEEDQSKPYCSEPCRMTLQARRYRSHGARDELARRQAFNAVTGGGAEPVTKIAVERRCRHCKGTFIRRQRVQIYCSKSCSDKALRKCSARDCLICATSFQPYAESAKYCGPACVQEARNRDARLKKAALATWHHRECRVCGEPFKTTRSRMLSCGPSCAKTHQGRLRALWWRQAREKKDEQPIDLQPLAEAA